MQGQGVLIGKAVRIDRGTLLTKNRGLGAEQPLHDQPKGPIAAGLFRAGETPVADRPGNDHRPTAPAEHMQTSRDPLGDRSDQGATRK